jgi:hypothetical protein
LAFLDALMMTVTIIKLSKYIAWIILFNPCNNLIS